METSRISSYQKIFIDPIKEKENSEVEKKSQSSKKTNFSTELKASLETLFSQKEVNQVLSTKEKEMLIELFEKKAEELSPEYNNKFSSLNKNFPLGGKLDIWA